jgi:membrane protein DedA with SNARE-associated domain
MSKSTAVLGAVLGGIALFLVGLWIGWTVGQQAAFYDCMERIEYDPALRHLCE